MMMFHVGQLVVCVDDRPRVFSPGAWSNDEMHGLTKGVIYTVRHVGTDHYWSTMAVWLAEIVRPTWKGMEFGYDIRRFRPVQDSALDIFRKTEAPVPENA